jgi:hypothetical protein
VKVYLFCFFYAMYFPKGQGFRVTIDKGFPCAITL